MRLTRANFARPAHWDLLSPDDTDKYMELYNRFHEEFGKSRKGERLDTFTDRLDQTRQFIESSEIDSWKRSLVSGVFFLRNALLLNIHQLRILVNKCKSSMNGSLQQLGYCAQLPRPDLEQELFAKLPLAWRDGGELKTWTFRVRALPGLTEPRPAPAPFIVPMLAPRTERVHAGSEAMGIELAKRIPCPVKLRYKFWDVIYSRSSETQA
jgi:hypothetical protein